MSISSNNERPIDRLRDGAGSLTIDTPDDGSPIREMISDGDRLLVVKDRGIYEVALADKIDPDRTNPNVPNTVQRILPFGVSDPWIGAVVLTAHQLYLSTCFKADKGKQAFNLALSIALELSGARRIMENHRKAELAASESTDLKVRNDRSFVLPAVGNVEASCNEYVQRLDHALQNLFETVQLFYSDVGSGGWDGLKTKIDSGPQGIDNFSQFIAESIDFLKLIRNSRNCVEHPRPEQRLIVSDFSIDKDNVLLPATIEVIHHKTSMRKSLVTNYFETIFESTVNIVELMTAFLCARNVGDVGGFQVRVIELPPDQRRSPHVRYSYGMSIEGHLTPML